MWTKRAVAHATGTPQAFRAETHCLGISYGVDIFWLERAERERENSPDLD